MTSDVHTVLELFTRTEPHRIVMIDKSFDERRVSLVVYKGSDYATATPLGGVALTWGEAAQLADALGAAARSVADGR